MIRTCIVDTQTNKCINILHLESANEWKDHAHFIAVDRNDGEIGWGWDGSNWIIPIPEISREEIENKIRQRRNKFLSMYIDSMNPIRWEFLTDEQKNKYIQYRQDLLDVPQQDGFPDNVIFPEIPEGLN